MLNLENIRFKPPTNGSYTVVPLQGSDFLNSTTSFIFGKFGYLPHDNENDKEHENEEKTIGKRKQDKEKEKGKSIVENNSESPTQTKGAISRNRSDAQLKRSTLYFYYALLLLDETTKITLYQWKKSSERITDPLREIICESIYCNHTKVFSADDNYEVIYDETNDFQTVNIDEQTGYPVVVKEEHEKYSLPQSCRIQQHIIFHFVNKLLQAKNMTFQHIIKKNPVKLVSSIKLKNYIDSDENGNIISKTYGYEELLNCIFSFFNYFLDSSTGITKQLIVGNSSCQPDEISKNKDCIFIGRNIFLEMIYQLRTTDLPMETIFVTFLEKQFNIQQTIEINLPIQIENEIQKNQIELTNGFLQMNVDGF